MKDQNTTPTQSVTRLQKSFDADISEMDATVLGQQFKEYIRDSEFGNWDGFSSRDVTGIRRMLSDFLLYVDQCKGLADEPENVQ